METTFYYTFSTIAQSIAGAMGLLGAFALFRLQGVNRQIEHESDHILDSLNNISPWDRIALSDLLILGQYSAFLEANERLGDCSAHRPQELALSRYKLEVLLEYQASVKSKLTVSLWLTGLLILASIIVLCFTPMLARGILAGAILGVAVLWVVACLVSYGFLIRQVLRAAMSGAVGRWARGARREVTGAVTQPQVLNQGEAKPSLPGTAQGGGR